MNCTRTDMSTGFHVVGQTGRSQAAVMVLGPHQATGGPENRHAGSDQWIYVVRGAGEAVVDGETVGLESGSLLLIEAGEAHEIRSTSDERLQMVTFYAPPEY